MSGAPALNGHILFSVRARVARAIFDPGSVFERLRTKDGLVETLDHWQARAAIETMLQLAASSPSFAQAIEARRAETASGWEGPAYEYGVTWGPEAGSVADESAVPEGNAP